MVDSGGASWWSGGRYGHERVGLGREDEGLTQPCPPTPAAHGDVDAGQAQHHRLWGFGFARFGGGLGEQGSAQGELLGASPIAQHAVVAQPGESAREHVQEEASDELAGGERHDFDLVAVGVVAPAESNVFGVEADEAVVGDGALVGVAPEVGKHVGGAGERRFSILPIISNSRCATRTIRYSDKRPLCFARRPTTESAIFE